jgi:hypothetical protein
LDFPPDLESVSDSFSELSVDEDDDKQNSRVGDDNIEVTHVDDIIINNGGTTEILTFMAAMLANTKTSSETELYDFGVSYVICSPTSINFLILSALNPKII